MSGLIFPPLKKKPKAVPRDTPPPKRKHISWSQLSMFTRCGEQYRRRYVCGEVRPPSVAMIVGSATHASIEKHMISKLPNNIPISLAEAKDTAHDSLNERWDQGVGLTEFEGKNQLLVRGESADMAVALAELHYTDLAPFIQPAHVERPWRIAVRDAGYDVIGYIDIQETTGRLRDTKTSSRTPKQEKADSSDQLTMYALASKALDGKIPTLTLDTLVKLKRKPKAVVLDTARSQADLDVLLRRIAVFLTALRKGVFPPASRDDWVCSRRWCGYYDSCPYVNGKVVI